MEICVWCFLVILKALPCDNKHLLVVFSRQFEYTGDFMVKLKNLSPKLQNLANHYYQTQSYHIKLKKNLGLFWSVNEEGEL